MTEEDIQYTIGKVCVHTIDLNTVKRKKGFSQGKCKKCGMTITRIYPIIGNPKRVQGHLTKKQRRKEKRNLNE